MTIRRTILLDCDGVLADFTACALDVIEEETGKRFKIEEIPRWDIFEALGYPEVYETFKERAAEPGFCTAMKPYPQALKGVRKLRKNYDIVVVTSPVDAMPWMYERAHWLEDKFDIPRGKVIFASEKEYVWGDMLVDDRPENVIAWSEANPDGLAVLWEHPYNKNVLLPDGVVRSSDWNELDEMMKEVFDDD